MSSHTITRDPETDKYYLINNLTGQCNQINKNGDYIKKFNIELTGKVNYKDRVIKANGDQAFMPFSTASLTKQPEFYIPQQDKFDGYCQLPRTLQPPYTNNKNKRPKTTIEQTKRLLKGRLKNEQYNIPHQLSHITGTAKDLRQAESQGKIQVLETRQDTKQNDFLQDTVKIINNNELSKPNLTIFKEYRSKPKTSQSLHRCIEQKHTLIQSESKTIVPLDDQKLKSIVSYQSLNNQQSGQKQQIFQSKTFNQSSQKLNQKATIDQDLQLFNVNFYNEQLNMSKKELQAFQLPKQKRQQQISSKGRFNVEVSNNEQLYNQDRLMMKLFQPELFDQKDSPKKIELEKQRRKLAKMKEQDMLKNNLIKMV